MYTKKIYSFIPPRSFVSLAFIFSVFNPHQIVRMIYNRKGGGGFRTTDLDCWVVSCSDLLIKWTASNNSVPFPQYSSFWINGENGIAFDKMTSVEHLALLYFQCKWLI